MKIVDLINFDSEDPHKNRAHLSNKALMSEENS
jgi:hypothetical protein